MIGIDNCEICGGTDLELISDRGRHNYKMDVVICKACGLAFINNRRSKEWYANYYEQNYITDYHPTTDDHVMPFLAPYLPEKLNKILEVGAGWGQNIIAAGELYPEAELFAIEPISECREYLTEQGVKIYATDAETRWPDDTKFDLIIMRGVVEHFLNIRVALWFVREHISDNGLIYILVPDCNSPRRPIKEYWFCITHIWYFNKYSLRNMLNVCGLDFVAPAVTIANCLNVVCKKSKIGFPYIARHVYNVQSFVFHQAIREDRRLFSRIKIWLRKLRGDL